GVKTIGSLRNFWLVRGGDKVDTPHHNDMVIREVSSGNARLHLGDVDFGQPLGSTVAIDGEVRLPVFSDVVDETMIVYLFELAGGVAASANLAEIKLERIVPGRGRRVFDIDAANGAATDIGIEDGDVIRVPGNLARMESSVRLDGNVHRPGLYQWFEGMTL